MQMPYLHSITARHAPINCRVRRRVRYAEVLYEHAFLCPPRVRESAEKSLPRRARKVGRAFSPFSRGFITLRPFIVIEILHTCARFLVLLLIRDSFAK